jgi:23S rRNA pseudouridine1911/1915/1917 synthase
VGAEISKASAVGGRGFHFAPRAAPCPAMADATLLDWLVRTYPLAKRQTLKRMVEARRVRINGRPAQRLKQPIGPQDQVQVSDVKPDSISRSAEEAPPVQVVYEDDDLIVVDKPAGLLTSTVPRERRPTLLAAVRAHVARSQPKARIGLIHRLDRDASGLLILSKNDPAYRSLKTQFFHHTVVREYRAVVHGTPKPPAGRIENRLIERTDGTVHATKQFGRGQVAISEYQLLKTERRLSLVRVVLQTGRKHQIRVHLAGNGNPVVGDSVYGPKERKAPRLMLAATRLVIMHPRTGMESEFTLPIPENFSVRE